MRVLFVSGIDGFCHRYQVLHRAAQLVALGASVTVRHFADPRLATELATHDLLFLYRVPETAAIRRLLAAAGDLGIPRIAAIDDLIFVDDARCLPDLSHLSAAERDEWRSGVRRYRATIACCDAFVAPTEPLVRIADGLGWRAHLHRNSIAPAELELGRRAREAAEPSRSRRPGPVLGYFSGTPSHDEDFASIARALRDVLLALPDARLLVVGPLVVPVELAELNDRIERRAFVAWDALPSLVASVDVCLAPLFAERPFAAAKGEIKYLEAAMVGVPTVATATDAYRHAIHDEENGLLATTQDEWRRALFAVLADPALRDRLGAAAARDVVRRYGEGARAAELLAIVEDVRGGLRRRGRGELVLPPPAVDDAPDERPAQSALEADARPAFPSGAPDEVTPPLSGGVTLLQRLRVARNGLTRVDVHAVTFGQTIARRVSLTLRRDDGTPVASFTLPATELPDRGWVALELDAPEAASAGHTYVLEIGADGGRGGSAPSFGLTTGTERVASADGTGALGVAVLDGAALGGSLALRGFAEWHLALAGPEDRGAVELGACGAVAPVVPRNAAGDAPALAVSGGHA
jgi:glycosyltransferase involved in cell wall biosynthesis